MVSRMLKAQCLAEVLDSRVVLTRGNFGQPFFLFYSLKVDIHGGYQWCSQRRWGEGCLMALEENTLFHSQGILSSVSFFGVVAIVIISLYFPLRAQLSNPRLTSFFGILEIVWPIGLGFAMLIFIRYLYATYETTTDNDHLLLGWTAIGWLITFALTSLLILHQQSMQVAIFRPAVVIADMSIGGAAFGLVIGGFHVESLDRQERLRSFRQAVEEAGHCIYFTAPDGTIEYVNPAFEDRTGYSAAEAIGRDPESLNSGKNEV